MLTSVADSIGTSEESIATSASVPESAQRPSFEELYRSHFEYVARNMRRFGVDGSQVEDAVQDVFLVMYRRIDDLRPGVSPRAFLFAIGLRVANGYRRTVRRKGTTSLDLQSLADTARSPFEWTASLQASRMLRHFLGMLDRERREVFMLAELEEMTAPEISQTLQVNLSTVYTRLRAARQRLVAFLDAWEDGEQPPRAGGKPTP